MLTEKQVSEIREHLMHAQNPLFFFDNDSDGLCSFLLLQRYIERGKGIPIKSFPDLDETYFRKVGELNADYVFILDKASVPEDFFKQAKEVNIPIVWIDHHGFDNLNVPKEVFYYNPVRNRNKSSEPVSALSYQITQKKEDIWIAFIGCISDTYFPDFYKDFKKYSDLLPDKLKSESEVLNIYYNSQLGKIAQMFNAGLKDKTTNVISMLKFLFKCKSPYEILEENPKTYFMHKRFKEIHKKYQKLIEKARENFSEKDSVLFFEYGGELSISSEVANGLKYNFPEKIIVVGYFSGSKINVSARGDNVREIVLKVVGEIEGATGGGHKDAVGAKVNSTNWEFFKKRFEEEVLKRDE